MPVDAMLFGFLIGLNIPLALMQWKRGERAWVITGLSALAAIIGFLRHIPLG